MNRLWIRLTLAFTLVILVVVGAIALLISQTTDTQFRQYITDSGMSASGRGMQQLVAYYEENGNWEGVGVLYQWSGTYRGTKRTLATCHWPTTPAIGKEGWECRSGVAHHGLRESH